MLLEWQSQGCQLPKKAKPDCKRLEYWCYLSSTFQTSAGLERGSSTLWWTLIDFNKTQKSNSSHVLNDLTDQAETRLVSQSEDGFGMKLDGVNG